MSCTKYNIIAIIGKSASGKDSIIKEIAKQCSQDVALIQQTTTRPRRENENENAYHFISIKEFQSNKDIIATTQFREWLYGTDLKDLITDKWNIGVFTPSSIKQLQNHERIANLLIFYIQADDRIRLERSLAREPQGDVLEMCRRMLADNEDFKDISFEYFPIPNNSEDDFRKAILQVQTIIQFRAFITDLFRWENGLLGKINEDN